MRSHFNTWLNRLPYQESVRRSQATTLQAFLLIFIGVGILSLIIQSLFAPSFDAIITAVVGYTLSFIFEIICIILLRNGHLDLSTGLLSYSQIVTYSVILLAIGFDNSGFVATIYIVPVALSGLIVGRRGLVGAVGLSISMIILIALLETIAPQAVGWLATSPDRMTFYVIPFILTMMVFALILDRFSRSLYSALNETRQREEDLNQLRASLEQSVAERTATLQQTVDRLSESQATIQELGAPILPVLPGVLVLPLIGRLDEARMTFLTQQILYAVSQQRTGYVILDLTSTALIDGQTMEALIRTTNALHLLGSEVLLVGIRAEAACTLVALGIDLSKLAVRKNLQEAVRSLMPAI